MITNLEHDLELVKEFSRGVRCVACQSPGQDERKIQEPTQGCSMTDHNLKVCVIVNLDIGGCGCTGGLEGDRSVCSDVAEETAPVPRCLPLDSRRE